MSFTLIKREKKQGELRIMLTRYVEIHLEKTKKTNPTQTVSQKDKNIK
jgi:hypothetical protein